MLRRIFDTWLTYRNIDINPKISDVKYMPKRSQRIKNKIKRKRK